MMKQQLYYVCISFGKQGLNAKPAPNKSKMKRQNKLFNKMALGPRGYIWWNLEKDPVL
jgi:hypothetical protein